MVNHKKLDHISVCICTYKRPELLVHALEGVISQITNSAFSFEVVVVDNDKNRSAEDTVREFNKSNLIEIIYECEPEQNIALARNKAIQSANGNFIAFIDDDEYTERDWLSTMHACLMKYEADAVLGPVLPDFPPGVPSWLKKSGLCERNRNQTGSFITRHDMRTGNILLKRCLFEEEDKWFDASRGLTGGEDGEFIGRQLRKGRTFIWCDDAGVFESVAPERWHSVFYLRKAFRIGSIAGVARRRSKSILSGIRPSIQLVCYAGLTPFSFLCGKHIWMRVLTKVLYNMGFVLSYFSLTSARYRQS